MIVRPGLAGGLQVLREVDLSFVEKPAIELNSI